MISPELPPSPDQIARTLLKQFQENFPVFGECKPLAIGIDKQLLAQTPDLNRKALRIALRIHTNSLRYLKGLEHATVRINLDGSAADEVTDAHRAFAAQTLQERFKKNALQRKAQREAEETQRKLDEAARQHAEKLNLLAEKFSRRS
jgi:ProP effector